MKIVPEILVTPDQPTVKFREPREKVDLDAEIPKILQSQGWELGTYFNIQFVSHDRTQILASCKYVVVQVTEGIHTSESNPQQPITRTVYTRKAEPIQNWWFPPHWLEDKGTVVWNAGRKKHEVKVGERMVYFTDDKDFAEKVASGEAPIPGDWAA